MGNSIERQEHPDDETPSNERAKCQNEVQKEAERVGVNENNFHLHAENQTIGNIGGEGEIHGKKEENGISYIIIENTRKTPKERYKKKAVIILSILLIVSGCLAGSAAVFKFYRYKDFAYITLGPGLFCGMIPILTGIIGLTSICSTTYWSLTCQLVLSIFSSLSGVVLISLAIFYYTDIFDYTDIGYIICGLFLLVLGILTSSFTCHACCGSCGCCGCCLENSAQITGQITSKPPTSLRDQTIVVEEEADLGIIDKVDLDDSEKDLKTRESNGV